MESTIFSLNFGVIYFLKVLELGAVLNSGQHCLGIRRRRCPRVDQGEERTIEIQPS